MLLVSSLICTCIYAMCTNFILMSYLHFILLRFCREGYEAGTEQGKKEGLSEGFALGWQEGCKLGEEVL